MLERETEIIIQILTDRTIGSGRSLALKDVLAAALPRGIKSYLRCEVARWMQDDLRSASTFSSFRFTTPLVHQLSKAFTSSLAPEYIFTREVFVATLENAVHFLENYLCRPQWTLEHFVFEKRERASLLELLNKFEYLSHYLYYARLVEGFMRQKGWQEIGVGDFRALLARIDDQIVKQHSPRELAQLTRPIFEFLLLQSEIAETPIPIKPLLVFFEDKKMSVTKDYVERICHIRGHRQLTIEQLGEILEDLTGGIKSKAASTTENRIDDKTLEENRSTPDFREPQGPGPTAVEAFPPATIAHQPNAAASGDDRRNIALSLTFSGMTESAQLPPSDLHLSDLRTTINHEQRERFIRTVFQNDEAYYDAVIDALNGMRNWKDASLYLQNYYATARLDPFVPDVVEFTDIVQLRYSLAPKT